MAADNMQLSVTLRTRRLIDLRTAFRRVFQGFVEQQALTSAAMIKSNIYAQRYGHRPLSPGYARWKRRRGLDPRILIATGLYVQSIGARPYSAAFGGRQTDTEAWVVSPAPGARHGKLALSTLGLWLEYGTRRMPARPHFRPEAARVANEMKRKGTTNVKKLAQQIAMTGKVDVKVLR